MTVAHDHAMRIACPDCTAPMGVHCTLTRNGKTIERHVPCLARTKAAPGHVSADPPLTAPRPPEPQRDITEPIHQREEN